jgi:Na+/H+ antiporter NhaD/arsenite permease-like protein
MPFNQNTVDFIFNLTLIFFVASACLFLLSLVVNLTLVVTRRYRKSQVANDGLKSLNKTIKIFKIIMISSGIVLMMAVLVFFLLGPFLIGVPSRD